MNTQDEDNTENKVHMLKFLGNKMGFMMQEELTGAAKNQDRDNRRRYTNSHSYLDRRALGTILSQEEKGKWKEKEKEEDPEKLMFLQ